MSQAGILNIAGGGGGGSPVQTLTGDSGGAIPPSANNINILGGSGVNVVGTPGTSTLTINVVNAGFSWTDKAVTFNAAVENGYFCTGVLTANLPASAGLVNGSTITIYVDSASVVTVQANTGQTIQIGSTQTVSSGSVNSTAEGSVLTLVYRIADTEWHSISVEGTWTIS
jgi:hypothetical protein